MKKLLVAANVGAISLIVLYGAIEYGAPLAAKQIWKEDYKELMFKCDHVMREHFLAKRAVSVEPNETTIKNLQSAEMGLIDCHDYDKLRKKMLVWGVSENRLSEIGLEALEERAYDLRRFVEIHEIRY